MPLAEDNFEEIRKRITPEYYLLYSQTNKIYYTEDDAFHSGVSLKPKEVGEQYNPQKLAQNNLRSFYTELLKNAAFKNLLVLSGAGISKEGVKKKTAGVEEGKDRNGLWDAVKSKFGEKKFEAIKEAIKFDLADNDIEQLLSNAYLYLKFAPNTKIKVDDANPADDTENQKKEKEESLDEVVKEIQKCVVNECNLEINGTYHRQFLDKLLNRNLKLPRVKFFTTNYDTIIEQAAQEANITLIDGFSFTMPRIFSGTNFDYDIVYREKSRINKEENFVPKVMHLYKMHGSLDWIKKDSKIQVCSEETLGDPLLIYPASNKYESSYEQPYFEMMSRFQNYLRQENTLLIVIGFSMYDKHISNVILEAVRQNPNFTLLICNYFLGDDKLLSIPIEDDYLKPFINENNVFIINEKFSDFVANYPSNNIYSNIKIISNEGQPVQP
jgi:hypothetical protein